jgi:hypothetical protein
MSQQNKSLWSCGCGSSNFSISDYGALHCSNCGLDYSGAWWISKANQQAGNNCKCGSPIFSIMHPGILFCPNCKKNASKMWQLVPAQRQAQNVEIKQPDDQQGGKQ